MTRLPFTATIKPLGGEPFELEIDGPRRKRARASGRAEPTSCAEKCLYCDPPLALTMKHDHDHVPTPRRHGGTLTFCVCRECHSLKDRRSFLDWNPDEAWGAFSEVWEALTPRGRIMLASMTALVLDALVKHEQARAVLHDFLEEEEPGS